MALTWTQRTTPTTYDNRWRAVCAASGSFVVVGGANAGVDVHRVMTSTDDGVTWVARSASSAGDFRGIGFAPTLGTVGRLCAVGLAGVVMTSDDLGVTWTGRTASEANDWYDIAWSPALTLFVAVSDVGTHRVMTSADGITWANQTVPLNGWQAVVWCPSIAKFVAGSYSSAHSAMYSANGTAWTDLGAVFGAQKIALHGLAWSPDLGRVIAVMQNNDHPIWWSTNATAWTQGSVPTTGASRPVWQGAAWGAGQFVVVGADGVANNNQVAESAAGATWTEADPGVATPEPWDSVAWGSDVFVAIATNATNDGTSVMTAPALGLAVTSIAASAGLTLGGTAVTITGRGFVDPVLVNFDNIAATAVVVVSSTSITCVTPAHIVGAVDVTVTLSPSGEYATLAAGYTYTAFGIASLSPTHGPVSGGTAVAITGLGFTQGKAITQTNGTSYVFRAGGLPDNRGDWTIRLRVQYTSANLGSYSEALLLFQHATPDWNLAYVYLGSATSGAADLVLATDNDAFTDYVDTAPGPAMTIGRWYEVIVTYDATLQQLELWRDGVSLGTIDRDLSAITWGSVGLLGDAVGGYEPHVSVEGLQIWDAKLTPDQVAAGLLDPTVCDAPLMVGDLTDHAGGDPFVAVGTITGTAPGIYFGGLPATSVVFVSDTGYTCVTPAHPEGGVTVTIAGASL